MLFLPPMNPLISVDQLSRYYGDFHAVADLSLEMQRGEVLGLLGPNGAGKSTTMRMISGNLVPSSGSIRLHDIDLLEQPRQAKANLGYLPEQPPLYPELTIDEYLRFCARLHRIPRIGIGSAIGAATERCGLKDMGRRLIGNLSKGYQQRVGIAQAIIHDPGIIILDEPTVGLDPNQILEIRSLIKELGRDHAIILSTHILPEVQSVCSQVLILHHGSKVFADSMKNIGEHNVKSLLLALERAPTPETLQTLSGVAVAEQLQDGRFRIQLDEDTTLNAIPEQIVTNGWGLLEFTPEQQNLEQIFTRLTTAAEI